jgi:hypothetical protein
MADTKISALPASTTPLAGTEVLPIVQSSTTKQVSVANLTAGRAISATSVTATTGNFVVGTSGQGIDFSATPGTGTSELLADYEEGTFSYNISDGTTSVGPLNGTYTKIGRTVMITFAVYAPNISTLSAGGQLRLTGLPFSGINDQLFASAAPYSNNSGINYFAMIGGTTLLYYKANTTVDLSALSKTDLGSPTFFSNYGSYTYQT